MVVRSLQQAGRSNKYYGLHVQTKISKNCEHIGKSVFNMYTQRLQAQTQCNSTDRQNPPNQKNHRNF